LVHYNCQSNFFCQIALKWSRLPGAFTASISLP
jgi:hypothetical protein